MKATKWQEMELAMMVGMYRERPPEAHKGNMGHALLVAGQTGIAGCALLAAESCMRSGVGKLTVFTPEENRLILQLGLPEAIVDTRFATPTDSFQAIGAGPGMGTDHIAMERLQNLLQTPTQRSKPLKANFHEALQTKVRLPQTHCGFQHCG